MTEVDTQAVERDLRSLRNILLKETDHWGLADYPATQAQLDYRQALRDVTLLDDWPTSEGWPVKPE